MNVWCEVERDRQKVKRQFKTVFQQSGQEVITAIMLVTVKIKQQI